MDCPITISPELAATAVLANTLASRLYMSFAFRTALMCVIPPNVNLQISQSMIQSLIPLSVDHIMFRQY